MVKKEKLDGIKYLVGNYHQDIWDDFQTHEEFWRWLISEVSEEETVGRLRLDVEEMLTWDSQRVKQFIYEEESGGLRLDTPAEARSWLEKLHIFFEEHK
ncbi:MAG: hypothetical protein RLZZ480_190 [Candidatus Parcubacteria bacterium]|jgi:hypothetical protein